MEARRKSPSSETSALRLSQAAAAILVLVIASGPARPVAARTAPTIAAALSATSVRVGWPVTIRGRVSPPGATPFVVVQRFVDGGWRDRERSVPATDGSYAVAIHPSQVATYTLRVRSAGGRIVSPTMTLQVVAVPTISAALSLSSVAIGSPVTITGTVQPPTATPRVVAQRWLGGRWVDRGSASVDAANGRYRITIHPSDRADYRLRVRSNGGTVVSATLALSTFYVARTMVDTGDAYPGEKVVAFTIDDGPDPTYTAQLLDVLADHGVKATFSIVGSAGARHPDLLRREVREGHHIANQSWSHPQLTTLSNDEVRTELRTTQDLIDGAGTRSRCVRPPYGDQNTRVQQLIADIDNSATLLWSIDPSDYRRPGASVIADRVMSELRPGAIIGIHDGGGDRSQTVEAVDLLIPRIQAAGYQIRPVC